MAIQFGPSKTPLLPPPTVIIGTQEWTLNNLNITKYRNGDNIPEVQDPTVWAALTTGAWCYYNNDSANEPIYGKLYNWYAVTDARGLAPIGFHIPTYNEISSLRSFLGGGSVAGGVLKETGTTHWQAPNTGATNSSGFTGLPGGGRSNATGNFYSINLFGQWWASDFAYGSYAYGFFLEYNNTIMSIYTGDVTIGASVRCIKD